MALAGLALFVSLALEWATLGGVPDDVVVSTLNDDFATLTRDAHVLWRVFVEPTLDYLVVLIGLMGVAVALFCAALSHVLKVGSGNQ